MKYFISFLLIFSTITVAQELNCKVTVNYESLPAQNRERLADFGGVIEAYMNSTQFTDDSWSGEKIDCSLNIFFTSLSGENERQMVT